MKGKHSSHLLVCFIHQVHFSAIASECASADLGIEPERSTWASFMPRRQPSLPPGVLLLQHASLARCQQISVSTVYLQ